MDDLKCVKVELVRFPEPLDDLWLHTFESYKYCVNYPYLKMEVQTQVQKWKVGDRYPAVDIAEEYAKSLDNLTNGLKEGFRYSR